MIFRLTFKTPDVADAVIDGLQDDLDGYEDLSVEREEAQNVIDKFVTYGESITIEFDSKQQTARVIPKLPE